MGSPPLGCSIHIKSKTLIWLCPKQKFQSSTAQGLDTGLSWKDKRNEECVWTVRCLLAILCPIMTVRRQIQQPGLRSHDDQDVRPSGMRCVLIIRSVLRPAEVTPEDEWERGWIVEERVYEYQLVPKHSCSIGAVVCPTNLSLLSFPSRKYPHGFVEKLITRNV